MLFIFYDLHPCCLLICFLVVSMAAPKVFCQDHSIAIWKNAYRSLQHTSMRGHLQSRQIQLGFCCLHWEPVFTSDTKAWTLLMRSSKIKCSTTHHLPCDSGITHLLATAILYALWSYEISEDWKRSRHAKHTPGPGIILRIVWTLQRGSSAQT